MSRQQQDQQQVQQREKTLVIMADYDGATGAPTQHDIKQKNQAMFHFIASEIQRYAQWGVRCKVVLAIGSARQSVSTDALNFSQNKNGSCANLLPALEAGLRDVLAKKQMANIEMHQFKFLVADLYGGYPDGYTLGEMKRLLLDGSLELQLKSQTRSVVECCVYDERKIVLLFVFLQKLTAQIVSI